MHAGEGVLRLKYIFLTSCTFEFYFVGKHALLYDTGTFEFIFFFKYLFFKGVSETFKEANCHSTKTTFILLNHPLNAVHLC